MALENIPTDLLDLFDITIISKTDVLRKFLMNLLEDKRNIELQLKELKNRVLELENV